MIDDLSQVTTFGNFSAIELMINKLHGLSPSGGLVSPSGGFASLFFDQVGYFASIKLCQALLSHQGAIIKIPVVRCHYLLCLSTQYFNQRVLQPRPRGVAKEKEMKKQKETEKKDEQSLLHE